MKYRHAVLALMTVAFAMAPGIAHADSVQYDFLTTASIAVDGGAAVSVNNATLSLVVDWTTGRIASISAWIPSNATGFESALLNDITASGVPFFSTVGFGTTLVSNAEADLLGLGSTSFLFGNDITATNPYGSNPIFGGGFIVGSASQEDLDTTFTGLYRDYSFQLVSDGTGGVYSFTEELTNTYIDFLFGGFATESVSIGYQVTQLTAVTPLSVPVPEPATAVLLGLGLTALLAGRARQRRRGAAR